MPYCAFPDVTASGLWVSRASRSLCCPGCSASTERGVRHQPKSAFGFLGNRCTTAAELAVRLPPKWLFVFARDTQLARQAKPSAPGG